MPIDNSNIIRWLTEENIQHHILPRQNEQGPWVIVISYQGKGYLLGEGGRDWLVLSLPITLSPEHIHAIQSRGSTGLDLLKEVITSACNKLECHNKVITEDTIPRKYILSYRIFVHGLAKATIIRSLECMHEANTRILFGFTSMFT